MKKLLPMFAGVLFGAFALGVAGATLYYSFNGLKLIFPQDLAGVLFGMMLFDFAVFTWFLVFISKCESTMQYVFAGIGFLIGLVGTLGLVGIEIGLSSGMLEQGTMAKPLTYIFVGVLIGHLLLLYAHHGSAPDVNASISMGVDLARVISEGQKQAEEEIKRQTADLGRVIANRQMEEVYRRMNIRPQVIEAKALPVYDDLNTSTNNYPVQAETKRPGAAAADFLGTFFPWTKKANNKREYEQVSSAPAQRSQDVGATTSPTANQHYHPMSAPIRTEEKKEREIVRETLPEIFRGEPIFFDSAIATNGPGVNVKIGDALQAILCEDGKYNISSINEVYAFARITEDELKYWRTGKLEEATQTGADFREGA